MLACVECYRAAAALTYTSCVSCRSFDGADVRGAQFENSILTGATFGKDSAGTWANLAGAHFEGALVSSSDVGRICQNPTLEEDTKKYELGCRATR